MASASATPSRDPLSRTLRFVLKQWRHQPALASAIAAGTASQAILEMTAPVYAGRLVDAVASSHLVHDAARGAALHEALWCLFVMLGLGLLIVLLRFAVMRGIVAFTLRIMSHVARDAFWRVQRFSTDWHANSFAGSTVRKISRGMWAFDLLNDTVFLALWPSLLVLIGATLLFGWHWPLMGLVVGLGSTAYVFVSGWLSLHWVMPAARVSNAWDSRFGGVLADSVGCNPVVKAFGAERREDIRIMRTIARWKMRTRKSWRVMTLSGTVQQALLTLLRVAVIGLAISFWWQGRATPGEVTFVLTAYGVIETYLHGIGQQIRNFQRSINDLEEMVGFHAEPLGVGDVQQAPAASIADGEIVFDTVSFAYPAQRRTIYDALSVRIPAGQRVGLVGPSGSGKTTFVKLVQRLYDVDAGRILIDGQAINTVTQESLRQRVAIVQQEPLLFHRSLAENIAYARPGASRAEIEEASRLAHADGFISRLPDGYATLVGERGIKLSGGERQRVAIARAFLADAPILIFDEATSSLDSESEALIQDAMERLMQGRTTLIIAHRLSTVRKLDRILVFDQGRIVEDDTHQHLMQHATGIYRRLVERQAAGMVELAM